MIHNNEYKDRQLGGSLSEEGAGRVGCSQGTQLKTRPKSMESVVLCDS